MNSTSSLNQRIFDVAFNQGGLTILDDLIAIKSVTHNLNWGMPASRLGLKQLIAGYRTGFPDLHCTIEDEINKGDRSAAL